MDRLCLRLRADFRLWGLCGRAAFLHRLERELRAVCLHDFSIDAGLPYSFAARVRHTASLDLHARGRFSYTLTRY